MANPDWAATADDVIGAAVLAELERTAKACGMTAEELLTQLIWDEWVARFGVGEA